MAKATICARCGGQAGTKTITKGSILIEIVLWLMFIVPGLIYSIWRHTTRHQACRSCGATELVPIESPAGRELARRFQSAN